MTGDLLAWLLTLLVVTIAAFSVGRDNERCRWLKATNRRWHEAMDNDDPRIRRAMFDLEGEVVYKERSP